MTRSSKLYKDSPRMERDEEGKVSIKKPSDKEKQSEMGDGEPVHEPKEHQGIPSHSRHVMERMEMHRKHEHEHHAHDHGGHGEKSEMHKRHHKEMGDMHKRHEKELKGEKSESTEAHKEKREGKSEGRKEEGGAKEKKD